MSDCTTTAGSPIDWEAVRGRLALAAEVYAVDASHLVRATDAQLNVSEFSLAWIAENMPGLCLDWVVRGDMRGPIRRARDFELIAREIVAASRRNGGSA